MQDLSEQDVLRPGLIDRVAQAFSAARPFMRFLCEAIDVPY